MDFPIFTQILAPREVFDEGCGSSSSALLTRCLRVEVDILNGNALGLGESL